MKVSGSGRQSTYIHHTEFLVIPGAEGLETEQDLSGMSMRTSIVWFRPGRLLFCWQTREMCRVSICCKKKLKSWQQLKPVYLVSAFFFFTRIDWWLPGARMNAPIIFPTRTSSILKRNLSPSNFNNRGGLGDETITKNRRMQMCQTSIGSNVEYRRRAIHMDGTSKSVWSIRRIHAITFRVVEEGGVFILDCAE